MIEDIDCDVFVRIQTDLLVIQDTIMTDRHHASNGNYEDDDPQNQIGGIIPAFSLSGWLRHGMEKIVQKRGSTACHPGEAIVITQFKAEAPPSRSAGIPMLHRKHKRVGGRKPTTTMPIHVHS